MNSTKEGKRIVRLKGFLILICFLMFGAVTYAEISEFQSKSATPQIKLSASHTNYTTSLNYPYSWVNASSGTELVLGDDNYVSTTLPFNFTFYDNNFSEITITTEGFLTFSFKSVQTIGIIPSSHPHRQNIIAPYWTNLDGTSGKIYVKNFSSSWVVTWENFNLDNGSYTGTFETILFENGDIVFNYDILENVSTYACGINYGDGIYYNSIALLISDTSNYSIKFSKTNGNSNGGNGGMGGNNADIIVAVTVPIGVIALAGGITVFYYRKNPEQFKAKIKDLKGRMKNASEKTKNEVKKIKNKVRVTPKKKSDN